MNFSITNYKILDKKRPDGISGHLRVKDDGKTIIDCVESIIDFLDELIITYQKSSDDTYENINKIQRKYPNKIRVYHYEIDLMPFHRTFKNGYKYSKDELNISNPINPANYYNFGLVKIKYKYYIKIDADQIYFSQKFKKIREKLFFGKSTQNKYLDKILDEFISCNGKYMLCMSGINVITKNNELLTTNKRLFFNGAFDHWIFNPDSNNFYDFYFDDEKSYEIMRNSLNYKMQCIGFCWIHIKNFKENCWDDFNFPVNKIFSKIWFNFNKNIKDNGFYFMKCLKKWLTMDKKIILDFCTKYKKFL